MLINPNYRLLIASTSTVHGSGYLEYILEEAIPFFDTKELLFISYARPSGISHQAYTQQVRNALAARGINVKGIEEFAEPKKAVSDAKAIFIGGGNTFLLLKTLYENKLIQTIQEAVSRGVPYMGSSAGSNITGLSIGTTNDMPIVYPPSFTALELLPFNINPHYQDPDPHSTHKGETRETRINEFHQFNAQMVIGLREGSWLSVSKGKVQLKGNLSARVFLATKPAFEIETGSLLNELIV